MAQHVWLQGCIKVGCINQTAVQQWPLLKLSRIECAEAYAGNVCFFKYAMTPENRNKPILQTKQV
jgi:hypothetical protein